MAFNFAACNSHMKRLNDKKFDSPGRKDLFARWDGVQLGSIVASEKSHDLCEWVSKTQRHVARATLAFEFYGGTDALGRGKLVQVSLHELRSGPGLLDEHRQV